MNDIDRFPEKAWRHKQSAIETLDNFRNNDEPEFQFVVLFIWRIQNGGYAEASLKMTIDRVPVIVFLKNVKTL